MAAPPCGREKAQGKERRLLSPQLSVRFELGTCRQGRDLLLEGGNNNHAALLTVRPDNDAPRNEPFHITFQRRVGLLTNGNTARFYLIRKNQAVIVERTRL